LNVGMVVMLIIFLDVSHADDIMLLSPTVLGLQRRYDYLDCLFSIQNSLKSYMIDTYMTDKYDPISLSSNMTKNAVWSLVIL